MKRTKKKVFLIILFSTVIVSMHSQSRYTATVQPIDTRFLMSAAAAIQEAHNQANARINNMEKSIINTLGLSIDETLRKELNEDFECLEKLSYQLNNYGISREIESDINKLENLINRQIINYNNRIAEQKARLEEEKRLEEARRKAEEPEVWSGTGFALKEGYIVTNYHVVEDAELIEVYGINGNNNRKHDATIVATDRFNDLALIKLNETNMDFSAIPYSIKTKTSDVGEEVFVLGYPLISTMGDEIKLTTGVISSKTGFQGNISLYQISAPIQPGNSGGPLFDSNGNVIGIVSAKHQGAENAGYAIKTSFLVNFLEIAVSSNILPQNNRISGLNLSEKVKSVKNYVYSIICASKVNRNPTYDHYLNKWNSIISNSIPYSTSGKSYSFPQIAEKSTNYSLEIECVSVRSDETVISISYKNTTGSDVCLNINKDAHIIANGVKHNLVRSGGLAYTPDNTIIPQGERNSFVFYFPPISQNTTSIDFMSSLGSFKGITLK